MITDEHKLKEAIQCCKEGNCMKCPLQNEICDTLFVDMTDVPVALLEKIEENLGDQ